MSISIALAVLVGFAAAGGSVAFWARSLALPVDRYHVSGPSKPSGDHPFTGGFHAVRDIDADPGAFDRLVEVADAAPRTERLAGSPGAGHVSFVTRSRVFGFPDITNIWRDGDLLQIRGHLVVGKSDMGVNERRIRGWLDAAGIG
ncbi:DUF1499 domain-containing protein [Palleronia aestuarii]|nr:DUF1499 domain-containing protein [Palleronia aestuarii]